MLVKVIFKHQSNYNKAIIWLLVLGLSAYVAQKAQLSVKFIQHTYFRQYCVSNSVATVWRRLFPVSTWRWLRAQSIKKCFSLFGVELDQVHRPLISTPSPTLLRWTGTPMPPANTAHVYGMRCSTVQSPMGVTSRCPHTLFWCPRSFVHGLYLSFHLICNHKALPQSSVYVTAALKIPKKLLRTLFEGIKV